MRILSRLGRLTAAGAAVVLLGATSTAGATVYQFQNLGTNFLDGGSGTTGNNVYVKVPGQSIDKNSSAGVFDSILVRDPGTAGATTIATYSVCNDLKQSIGWAGGGSDKFNAAAVVLVTDTSVALPGSGSLPDAAYRPDAAARSQVAYLMDSWLYGAAYQGSSDTLFKTDAVNYATDRQRGSALQAAIWSLWYGSPTTVVTPSDSGVQSVMDNLLADASAHTNYASSTAIWVYNSQSPGWYQDQLMVLNTPVPEPVFYQMAGMAGLVMLGFRLRRGSARSKA